MQSAVLTAYNYHGDVLGPVKYIEVQWSRRWQEAGQWTAYMSANDWNPETKYVRLAGRPEWGIVQRMEYNEKKEGDFITLSGFFIHALLNWKQDIRPVTIEHLTDIYPWANTINGPTITGNQNSGQTKGRCFYSVDCDELYEDDTIISTDPANSVVLEQGTGIADGLYTIFSDGYGSNYSFYSDADFNSVDDEPQLGHIIHVVEGTDRSDQIVFSKSRNNTSNIEYVKDESAIRSGIRAYIDSEVDGSSWWPQTRQEASRYEKRSYYAGGGEQGQNRFELFKNHSVNPDSPSTRINMVDNMGSVYPEVCFSASTENEVKSANKNAIIQELTDQGRLEMLNHYKEESITVETIQTPLCRYLMHYDLGDIVTVSIDRLEVAYDERIIGVDEVHSKNMVTVTLELGNPRKRKWRNL